MPDALRALVAGGPAAWAGLGRWQQLLILAVGLLLPVAILVGSYWTSGGEYVPLFAGLSAEEAGGIVTQLKASKTPYRLHGDQVLVPADRVGEARVRLAAQGLPLGGGVGFEVFDRTSFGVSDFAQRLNYQRALQGELARTIGQLHGVARARVHLVMPPPSLFAERARPASASVFLKLAPGAQLGAEQVRGIVHLVASSVEGLGPDRVTVVDTGGRVLLAGSEPGPGAALSPRRLEVKTAVEEGLERRVQSLLDSVLGPGQAVIRVSAQLNFDQVERTEERFDPTPVPRQETRTVESSRSSASTPVVGTSVVPPPAPAPAGTTSTDGNRESESVSYEVSKLVARTLTTPGEIQRLSVAVMLNAGRGAAGGEAGGRAPAPRSAEEVEKLRRVVMGAVGYDAARGDEVTIVELPFDTSLLERERALLDDSGRPAPGAGWVTDRTITAVVMLVVVVLVFVWLTRRQSRQRALAAVTRSLESTDARTDPSAGLPASPLATGVADRHAASAGPEVPEEFLRLGQERKGLRQRALAVATGEPDASAQLIRAWMSRRKLRPAGGGDAG